MPYAVVCFYVVTLNAVFLRRHPERSEGSLYFAFVCFSPLLVLSAPNGCSAPNSTALDRFLKMSSPNHHKTRANRRFSPVPLTPLNQIQLKKRQIEDEELRRKSAGNPHGIYILQATHLESIFCRYQPSVNNSNEWTCVQDTPKGEGEGIAPKGKPQCETQTTSSASFQFLRTWKA
jgi:hypothetical protein